MIAIIPARLGSKRLPRKNIRSLCGKPLIAYTIEAALESDSIDGVYVSTDDEAVAGIARSYGVHVPFLRPDYLGADAATTEDVCEHLLNFLSAKTKEDISSFMLLQPTSPLRTAKHIAAAVCVFKEMDAQSVISVTAYEHPVQWALTVQDGVLCPCDTFALKQRSQNCEVRFHPNGAIYIFETDFFLKRNGYYGEKTYPFIMDGHSSVDIDTKFDLELAEFFLQRAI